MSVALAIGTATFAVAAFGVIVGRVVGAVAGRWAEAVGGELRPGIGVAILHKHFGAMS